MTMSLHTHPALPETAMSEATITRLTLDSLRDVLQQAGYRVETVTDPVANIPYLRSATGGLPFDIRPGSRLADGDQSFADVALVAVFQVQGDLPLDVVNRWNATRRFARLQLSQPFLVFSMDLSVFGGVAPAYLRGQVETWDRLVQELIPYLRDELRKVTAATAANPAPVDRSKPDGQHQPATATEASGTIQ